MCAAAQCPFVHPPPPLHPLEAAACVAYTSVGETTPPLPRPPPQPPALAGAAPEAVGKTYGIVSQYTQRERPAAG